MRFELLPLLGMAREGAKSVDRLLRKGPDPIETGTRGGNRRGFERYYDRLLVHGDPQVAGFERSFGATPRLAGKLHYTGYVVQDLPAADSDAGAGEVLISAGGGATGQHLLEMAIAARPLTSLRDRNGGARRRQRRRPRRIAGARGPTA